MKRESQGFASRHLHDAVEVGSSVRAYAPAGDFVLDHDTRPVVLVSAGVGVTPMVSMLHALALQPTRPVYVVHGARNGRHHPLADEVRRTVAARENATLHVVYSRPRAEEHAGEHYDSEGRIDGARLEQVLPDFDAEYFLTSCADLSNSWPGSRLISRLAVSRPRSRRFLWVPRQSPQTRQ